MTERATTIDAPLTQAVAEMFSGWMPMETAPQDGSWFIGLEFYPEPTYRFDLGIDLPVARLGGRPVHVGLWQWADERDCWEDEAGMADGEYEPAYWMPIPSLGAPSL